MATKASWDNLVRRWQQSQQERRLLVAALHALYLDPNSADARKKAKTILMQNGVEGRQIDDQDRADFERLAPGYGMDPAWYGANVIVDVKAGRSTFQAAYTVVGIDTRRPVNSVVLRSSRGKLAYTTPKYVADKLGGELARREQPKGRDLRI